MQNFKLLALLPNLLLLSVPLLLGLVWAKKKISQEYRARNRVERAINVGLILCSGVAILTTIGIVMSMFGEAMHFFHFVKSNRLFLWYRMEPRL